MRSGLKEKSTLDPITYEIIKHKVWQILWEGRETMLKVSGSPVVCEAKEAMFALYDGNGDTVASSAGLLLHVIGCEQMIKNITEWYFKSPGIYDGDVFIFNDAYVGGAHNPDIACLAPIFYTGRLVAWLGDLTHTSEVGAIEPGGMPPSATEVFHEGLRLPGLKIVERGEEQMDVYKLLERSVRDPAGMVLDTKARVAGLNVGKMRMLELINKHGMDTMTEVFKNMVDDSEKVARAKLREIPDGTWRQIVYMDHDGKNDRLMKISCTVTKKQDELIIDFTGTDPQTSGATNSALPATYGAVFVSVCSLLFWEEQWNRGTMRPVRIIAPEGTLVNANWPAAVNQAPGRPGIPISDALDIIFSKMLITVDRFYEDQNAGWCGNNTTLFWGGKNQHGRVMSSILFDALAGGQGAGSTMDGTDAGCFQMTPEVVSSDVEMQETIHPFLYLCRRIATDSGGAGKFRGGCGLELIYMLHNTEKSTIVTTGAGQLASYAMGIYGGYPCSASRVILAKTKHIKKNLGQGKVPYTPEDILKLQGDVKECRPMMPATEIEEGSLIYIYMGAGGGYGDPLDRAPEAVGKNVKDGIVSMEYAKNIYGVAVDSRSFAVDSGRTEKLRRKIRSKRADMARAGRDKQ
jgi:N-methylhydantoinase B